MAEDETYDFDAVLAAQIEESGVGPTYKLKGRKWQCLAVAPAHTLRDLIGEKNGVDGTFNYLKDLLVEEQREEFQEEVLDSDDIDLNLLSKVVSYLMEKYNGRSFESASPSA